MTDMTREDIKAVRKRQVASEPASFNPSLHPAKKLNQAVYEDLMARSGEFGLGSVLVEKLATFEEGATLLDYFAAEAANGILAADTNMRQKHVDVADYSYGVAEAMLRKRREVLQKLEEMGAS